MKVLLTRPQGRNQAMVATLNQHGVPHLVTPLLSVVSYQDNVDFTQVRCADIIIFISTNAVYHAFQQHPLDWPKQAQYFAVGEATSNDLKQRGIHATQTPTDNQKTEGLLELDALQQVNSKNVIIVRGVGGREDLAEQLQQRGATVNYWQVYQRTLPPQLPTDICQQWQQFGINTIVITSGEILSNLLKVVTDQHFLWLQHCRIIVPSVRVVEIAQQFGLTNVIDANGANTATVTKAIGLDC